MAKKSQLSPRPPSATLLKRLDEEHFQRAKDAWHTISDGNPTGDSRVVSSEAVRSALIRPKLILSSFNISEIYSNYIFSNRLFVLTCPKCIKDSERPTAIEVLKRGDLIPVLVGDYADYAPEVIGAILQMPHMSRHELQVYRTMRVVSAAENQICAHCVKERYNQINKKLAAFDKGGILRRTVRMTLNDLHPFVNPDFELIDALHDAVDAKDAEAIFSLAGASGAINGLRTSQAFDSRWILEAKEMPHLIKGAKKFVKEEKGDSVSMTKSLIEPLSVIVSPKMEV